MHALVASLAVDTEVLLVEINVDLQSLILRNDRLAKLIPLGNLAVVLLRRSTESKYVHQEERLRRLATLGILVLAAHALDERLALGNMRSVVGYVCLTVGNGAFSLAIFGKQTFALFPQILQSRCAVYSLNHFVDVALDDRTAITIECLGTRNVEIVHTLVYQQQTSHVALDERGVVTDIVLQSQKLDLQFGGTLVCIKIVHNHTHTGKHKSGLLASSSTIRIGRILHCTGEVF